MTLVNINSDEMAICQLRSCLKTLIRYRNTSMALHGRLIESVPSLAAELLVAVNALADQHATVPAVQRWVAKFHEYVQQHALVNNINGKGSHGKAKEDRREILSNVRQDRADTLT